MPKLAPLVLASSRQPAMTDAVVGGSSDRWMCPGDRTMSLRARYEKGSGVPGGWEAMRVQSPQFFLWGALGIGFAPVGWECFATLPPKPPEKGGGDRPMGVHSARCP